MEVSSLAAERFADSQAQRTYTFATLSGMRVSLQPVGHEWGFRV